ncbi:MAG: hypothetical protein JWN48_4299 [Myxococcaceae bacterium]|nr:hypothetical protein [Myxococcaceae bacterium]
MAFNIHLDVPNAKGESKKDGKEGQIELISWNWGMSNSGDAAMSSSNAGRVDVHDLVVTKYVDNSSGYLMGYCCTGEAVPKITLSMDKAQGDNLEFVSLVLERCVISSVATGGGAVDDRLTETVHIRFGAFAFTYQGQGENDPVADLSFDITANKKG